MACYLYNLGSRVRCASSSTCTVSELNNYYMDYNDNGILGNSSNWTTPSPTGIPPKNDIYIGYITAVIAVIMFGINFVPVKKYDCRDGMFFQFIMCNAALAVGIIINAIQGFPTMYPLAMLGGFLWCTGNIVVVKVIQSIGMGLGLLLWNSSNLLIGWAGGKWGWFGINPQPPNNIGMNYAGVVLALISAVLFVAIKPNEMTDVLLDHGEETAINTMPPRTYSALSNDSLDSSPVVTLPIAVIEGASTRALLKKRFLGVLLALCAGCLFGNTFVPVIYIQDHPDIYPNASKNGMDYILTFYLGIYATSLTYFLVYCAFMRNRPYVNGELVLPSIACGIMWAMGQAGFMLAIEYLSETVSFPIIASGPGLIAAIVGVLVFKEIRGTRNYVVLAAAFVFAITGAILSALSKM